VRVLLDVSAVPVRPVGAGVYTIALARGLDARREVELHLLTRRRDESRWSAIAPHATVHALVPDRRPLRLAWEQLAAPEVTRTVRPDVWHGPHYTLPLRLHCPRVVTVHDVTFFEHPEWHERTKVVYFRRMIRSATARAAVVVCISEYTAARLRVHCEISGETIVVPHGVDVDRFSPAPPADARDADPESRADARELAAHGIVAPYIAFAGTIEPRKNLPMLVHAFARVARERPDLRLVLAGADGWGIAELREAIAGSGVATRILKPGYLPDETLAALFRRALAVVYPSFEEGFGLPALEALASGAPLVSTRCSAIEEIVGDAALLVPARDVHALGDALHLLLSDGVRAARLRQAGPGRAAKFTWERSVDGHLDAYERAIAARPRA
jgi:glycosyltransferase involved in cell wall biosynthesis